ncbi:hypothetical protein COCNU_07G011940 [Cocos nucifera]|uniref:Peptidase S8/S53 domain-containing protein n=1 Tax=Cocos nucifera TaxID=13894 RepID=A0A8K0IGJ7_COCNU|nr:hypothetical protein COCNU_07G011940 [Cocos nucifera]
MFVANADALGQATGTAAGMAPYAHVAVYKVCTEIGCFTSDMLAGLDNAIQDGVDVLSLSLGGYSLPFFDDGIAIGAFRAVEKGIFVSCAAGNEGPFNATVSNEAPWILTVGASTIDREIRVTVELGNGVELIGQSAYQPNDFVSAELPQVYPGLHGGSLAAVCKSGSLKDIDVKGKVVVCDADADVGRVNQGRTVKRAGGAAMILANKEASGFTTMSDTHVLPAAHVSYYDGLKLKSYISSASAPTASITFHVVASTMHAYVEIAENLPRKGHGTHDRRISSNSHGSLGWCHAVSSTGGQPIEIYEMWQQFGSLLFEPGRFQCWSTGGPLTSNVPDQMGPFGSCTSGLL